MFLLDDPVFYFSCSHIVLLLFVGFSRINIENWLIWPYWRVCYSELSEKAQRKGQAR